MKKLVAALIIFLAFLLRFWNLSAIDYSSDELHYVSDAFRFYSHDPYISVRHHPFHHPMPSIGHPFLQPILTSFTFNLFGHSLVAPRFVPAMAGVLTALLLLSLTKILGAKTALLSGFLLAISPFAVRFNRDAHLDSVLTLFVTTCVVALIFYSKYRKNWLLILVGIASGLAISTKLDGIVSLVVSVPFFFLIQISKNGKKSFFEIVKGILLIVFVCAIVSFIFNDPASYLDGIIHPSDPSYRLYSINFWLLPLQQIQYWIPVFYNLLSPTLLLTAFASFIYFLRKPSIMGRIIVIWQLSLLPLAIFHSRGLSGEYGLLPLIPAVAVSISYFLVRVKIPKIIVFVCVIISLYFLFLNGFRLSRVPYIDTEVNNQIAGENFYSQAIQEVNDLAPAGGKVFFLPQSEYPFFALRKDLSWSYFGNLSDFSVLVVDDKTTINGSGERLKLVDVLSGHENGVSFFRKIYLNSAR